MLSTNVCDRLIPKYKNLQNIFLKLHTIFCRCMRLAPASFDPAWKTLNPCQAWKMLSWFFSSSLSLYSKEPPHLISRLFSRPRKFLPRLRSSFCAKHNLEMYTDFLSPIDPRSSLYVEQSATQLMHTEGRCCLSAPDTQANCPFFPGKTLTAVDTQM